MGPLPEEGSSKATNRPDEKLPLDISLSPVDPATEEQQKLWEAYREQQRRRSCPGCGDDGLIF
jgi:hypothetical protein